MHIDSLAWKVVYKSTLLCAARKYTKRYKSELG